METRGLTEYKLSQLSSVSQSTINSLYAKNNMPSIPTLEDLCEGLGITMSEFFSMRESEFKIDESERQMYQINTQNNENRMQNMTEMMLLLSEEDKALIEGLLKSLTKTK